MLTLVRTECHNHGCVDEGLRWRVWLEVGMPGLIVVRCATHMLEWATEPYTDVRKYVLAD